MTEHITENIALTLKEQKERRDEILSEFLEKSTEITFKLPGSFEKEHLHELVKLLFVGTIIQDIEVYTETCTLNPCYVVKVIL